LDRVKALAPQHPEWKEREPFKSVLAGDRAGLAATGEKGMLEIVAATHSGMTVEQFSKTVEDWVATARHPRFDRPYTKLIYQPMLELMTLLRANQFKTFIVSGGGVEFMRPWREKVYGIPPEQVVGSSGVVKYELRDGKPVLVKEPKVEFIDDGPGKPAASTASSAAGRPWRSATPMATSRCWNTPRAVLDHASWGWCITPMRRANMPMTASLASAVSTRRGTRPCNGNGLWST
jgi:hypothetical protein